MHDGRWGALWWSLGSFAFELERKSIELIVELFGFTEHRLIICIRRYEGGVKENA